MSDKTDKILNDIFLLDSPKIDGARRDNIDGLLQNTINGDAVVDYLAMNANVKKDVVGALVYVLTNRRIIKFEIDPNEIKSASFLLDTITGFERTLEGERAGIQLSFPNGSFGIKYAASNQKISDFFQKVDQARVSPHSGSVH